MAVAYIFTFLTIIIIFTARMTREQNKSTLTFTKADTFNGSINVSLPDYFRRYQLPHQGNLTIWDAIQLAVHKYKGNWSNKHHVQKRSGRPGLLDLLDFATKKVKAEQIEAPAVILPKNSKKPKKPVFWIWEKFFLAKE